MYLNNSPLFINIFRRKSFIKSRKNKGFNIYLKEISRKNSECKCFYILTYFGGSRAYTRLSNWVKWLIVICLRHFTHDRLCNKIASRLLAIGQ